MPLEFLLIRRTPLGKITAYGDTAYRSFAHAATAARGSLIGSGVAGSATARLFADGLGNRPLGAVLMHKSGYRFRILIADHTADGAPILPGARLFNYYDRQWGTILPGQFMAEGVLYPGGQYFDHWYDFARESDGWINKLNGERLATKEN